MSEKELLYVKDMLGHLEYLKEHAMISRDCLSESQYANVVEQIIKVVDKMYVKFYGLLGGN